MRGVTKKEIVAGGRFNGCDEGFEIGRDHDRDLRPSFRGAHIDATALHVLQPQERSIADSESCVAEGEDEGEFLIDFRFSARMR